MPLSESTLLIMAGDLVYARGEDYAPDVQELRITEASASASIQGTSRYTVELDWSGRLPDGSCTCPHYADGHFCKHLVATGLAVIDSGQTDGTTTPTEPALEAAVQAMDVDELRELVLTLAQRYGGVRRLLEIRATAASGDDARAKAELEAFVRNRLGSIGFVYYDESYGVAESAGEALDELEDHLNSGAAEIVRPALLSAVTCLRTIVEQADDSSGVIGEQCQRAADLYAQACRQGRPDPVELAKWLVKFRADSPGWPNLTLADFVDAFDKKALNAYRREVADLERGLDDRDKWHRYEVEAMLLELADHDGDVDRAVQLLSQREHPRYGAIVARLREAERPEEAVAWIDRAVAEGRVSGRGGGTEYWLSPSDVAETYHGLGRTEDAMDVFRADFIGQPSVSAYQDLLEFAARIDRADTERTWALNHARDLASDPHTGGAVLIELLLSEGAADAAWQAADRYGPGRVWQELATQGASARPVEAADLYRPQLEADLQRPNTRLYPGIAATLATMAKLYEQGGRTDDFAKYIAQIRQDYGRRPALMKALDARRL